MFSGIAGWRFMIVLAVLAIIGLAVWGIYWITRLGARRGMLDRPNGAANPHRD